MAPARSETAAWYGRYLACCDDRRFDEPAGSGDERVTGRAIVVPELARHRTAGGKIYQCRGDRYPVVSKAVRPATTPAS
ncbi:hypothetical protein [Paractinoplanes abujensis]|uniref:Uncharacterized protein n=1 Tax=Paractinoplanes abujensis TaxID=882441 RepID=A0A7W7CN34_9ACTN|nr:hypothetical protein [Actinoplanes abujensis]MBB4691619.1 hypothetical protein [Actinoplanes abujensis]